MSGVGLKHFGSALVGMLDDSIDLDAELHAVLLIRIATHLLDPTDKENAENARHLCLNILDNKKERMRNNNGGEC